MTDKIRERSRAVINEIVMVPVPLYLGACLLAIAADLPWGQYYGRVFLVVLGLWAVSLTVRALLTDCFYRGMSQAMEDAARFEGYHSCEHEEDELSEFEKEGPGPPKKDFKM